MKKILSLILVISISLFFLAFSIEINSYNKNYYLRSYEKHGVYDVTKRSEEDLSVITNDIISYLKGHGGDELLTPHFNEREVLHMRDVQDLFNLARTIKYISFLVSLAIIFLFLYRKEYISLGRTLFYGPFFLYFLLILLAILASKDFTKYFTYFHLVFFDNDLWILDPRTDLMIQMLPEAFFMGMALRILLSFLVFLSIIQIIGKIYERRGLKSYENLSGEIKGNIFKKQ
ncbi:MAG: TIGR01906 family membrane protein [Tissierellia bacterium]|nr:TIGR01906 family membrane protein [Tissierellia bacterium]